MAKMRTIDEYFYLKLGEIIHEERKKRGYSLRYLNELTGISRTTIDGYELGTKRIDKERWKKLSKALQIPEQVHIKVALGQKEYH